MCTEQKITRNKTFCTYVRKANPPDRKPFVLQIVLTYVCTLLRGIIKQSTVALTENCGGAEANRP